MRAKKEEILLQTSSYMAYHLDDNTLKQKALATIGKRFINADF